MLADESPDDDPGSGFAARVRRAAGAALLARALQLVLAVGFTAALARLLAVEDFGLVQMALTLFVLLGALLDFGLQHAVVHHGVPPGAAADALARRNALLAAGLTAVMVPASLPVAAFFAEPRVVPLMAAIAVAIGIATLFNLHVALLRHHLRFTALALAEVGAALVAGAAAVAIALLGGGAWALVAQLAVQRIGAGAAAWALSGWRPRWRGRGTDVPASLHGYARHVTLARVLGSLARNTDRLVVGRIAGEGALGLYQTSFRWALVPAELVGQPLLNVAVSAFSRVHHASGDDASRYRQGFRLGLEGLLAAALPACVLVALEAELVVRLLLGARWLDAVPMLRVLALAAGLWPISQAAKWSWLGEGRTGAYLRFALLSAPVTAGAVVLAGVLGRAHRAAAADLAAALGRRPETAGAAVAVAVACAYAAAFALLVVPTALACCRGGRVRLRDFALPALHPLAATAAGFLAWSLVPAPALAGGELEIALAALPRVAAFGGAAGLVLAAGLAPRIARLRRGRAVPAPLR